VQLENKVAIVTGASLGIGRAIAIAFAKEGAAVAVDYRSHPDEANELVERIEDAGGKGLSVRADVTKPEDVANLVRKPVEEFGHLDIMVNNAGIEHKMPFLETPREVWDKVVSVNLTGPWLGCQAAAKQLVSQGGSGRIPPCTRIYLCRPTPRTAPLKGGCEC
jgi:glucose 1-dehydrogenase